MDKLPDELLLMIFDKLPPRVIWLIISKVCRRWKRLASYRVGTIKKSDPLSESFKNLLGIYVTSSLRSYNYLNEHLRNNLSSNLGELVISNLKPLCEDAMLVISTLKKLQHLDVLDDSKSTTIYLPTQLKSIVVNNNTTEYLLKLANFKQIKALHMYRLSNYYSAKSLKTFLYLQALNLTDLTLRCPEMKDSSWEALGTCLNLVHLRLYSCWLAREPGVSRVLSLPKLRLLHLTACRMIRSQALHLLINKLPSTLCELNLSATSFSNDHIPSLISSNVALERLELWRCSVTSRALVELASAMTSLRDLDTDVELGAGDVAELEKHPRLQHLRCCFRDEVQAHSRLRGSSAGRAPAPLVRGCGEGPSADMYFHSDAYAPSDGFALQYT